MSTYGITNASAASNYRQRLRARSLFCLTSSWSKVGWGQRSCRWSGTGPKPTALINPVGSVAGLYSNEDRADPRRGSNGLSRRADELVMTALGS